MLILGKLRLQMTFCFFLGKQCYEKMHIVNTEKTVVQASPGRGLHLVMMAAG